MIDLISTLHNTFTHVSRIYINRIIFVFLFLINKRSTSIDLYASTCVIISPIVSIKIEHFSMWFRNVPQLTTMLCKITLSYEKNWGNHTKKDFTSKVSTEIILSFELVSKAWGMNATLHLNGDCVLFFFFFEWHF